MDETADCHKERNSPDEAFDDSSVVYAFSDGTKGPKLGINMTDVKLESAYLSVGSDSNISSAKVINVRITRMCSSCSVSGIALRSFVRIRIGVHERARSIARVTVSECITEIRWKCLIESQYGDKIANQVSPSPYQYHHFQQLKMRNRKLVNRGFQQLTILLSRFHSYQSPSTR
jgi:hypothetical protein